MSIITILFLRQKRSNSFEKTNQKNWKFKNNVQMLTNLSLDKLPTRNWSTASVTRIYLPAANITTLGLVFTFWQGSSNVTEKVPDARMPCKRRKQATLKYPKPQAVLKTSQITHIHTESCHQDIKRQQVVLVFVITLTSGILSLNC